MGLQHLNHPHSEHFPSQWIEPDFTSVTLAYNPPIALRSDSLNVPHGNEESPRHPWQKFGEQLKVLAGKADWLTLFDMRFPQLLLPQKREQEQQRRPQNSGDCPER